jgi:3,4-dihydroxy 2-butanone 4-phosphate synthase/GTP cyclohydrolase II
LTLTKARFGFTVSDMSTTTDEPTLGSGPSEERQDAPREARLADALGALRRGEFVVVSDDHDREDEADLVMAAQFATSERLAFLVRHTSGIVCAPMPPARADQLGLVPMVADNTEVHHTAFTVTVDARHGTTTGISASDRATTLRALAADGVSAADFVRPGHIFPLRAHPGGIAARGGHTEASVDLLGLAGMIPVAVISELVADDGRVLSGTELRAFVAENQLPRLSVEDIRQAARKPAAGHHVYEHSVHHLGSAPLPTRYGTFTAQLLRTEPDGLEHLVLKSGDSGGGPMLVRVHSECATGDLFGSLRCDCGEQLDTAMREIERVGRGILVYERGHEGRGIGLADKLRAYALQDTGADTIDANLRLGHPADARDFHPAARVLEYLGVRDIVLLTNNPDKVAAARDVGLQVQDRPLWTAPGPDNVRYLETKRVRLGHHLPAVLGQTGQ